MNLNKDKITYICSKALKSLKEKDLVVFKSNENSVLEKMISAFLLNIKEEEAIDAEVKRLIKENSLEGVNYSKAFNMIKKELAKKKGFKL